MKPLALDTSVAVPLLHQIQDAHAEVVDRLGSQPLALSGHAAFETYSVLTRLPGPLRVSAEDAMWLLSDRLEAPYQLAEDTSLQFIEIVSRHGIVGGGVYDALVGLAALDHDVELATRDRRARRTYDLLSVRVRWLD